MTAKRGLFIGAGLLSVSVLMPLASAAETGKGHITRTVGTEDRVAILIPVSGP
jgi:uncharacterized membrane protein (DUF441 family)